MTTQGFDGRKSNYSFKRDQNFLFVTYFEPRTKGCSTHFGHPKGDFKISSRFYART